ncbi:MAG: pyruvate carboxylase subunit B [Desulfobacterales bacterium]|nr:pyruvate carboxylase subunit B [Desulfobacterales bacterium]
MGDHNKVEITKIDYGKNRPKAKNPIKIMDLSLRDGHQSLFATRGRTEDMIPVAEMMDEVGFWAVETWGGATFDTMHRFLNEDPWERIRTLKRYFKKTPMSMLLRAQNLVGYRNYADDVAKEFVDRAAANGIDVFRTFDALNDFRNFETVVSVIKKCGKHFQGCMCFSITEPRMGGDVYNLKYYVNKAKDLERMGADSVCIKDMAGMIAPYDAYSIVKELKAAVSVPVHLHSHFTSGMADMAHLKAIEAGVDIVDTCLSPMAYRTSHPAVEPFVMTLMGTNRDTGFDIKLLADINKIFEKDIIPKYRHLLDDTKLSIIDINVLLHQTPGGMLSNLVNQLKGMNALDRIEEVYEELPKVRKELGQVPLVTPTSQIVGVQTVNNVLFDDEKERYKMITGQVKDLCYGLYGRTPVPIDPEVKVKSLKGYPRGEDPITCKPADVLEPELEKAKKDVEGLAKDIDDVLIYALYPVTGKRFLKWKYGKEQPPAEVRPKTMEHVKAEQELIKKALEGKLIEKPQKEVPPKGECLRKFNVFVDDEYFEVGVEEQGGVPVARYIQQPLAAAHPVYAPQPLAAVHETSKAPVEVSVPKAAADFSLQRPAVQKAPKPVVKSSESSSVSGAEGIPLKAPMPGMIIKYEKVAGDTVNKGETIVILEAMKMENALPAPASGTIKSVNFKTGDSVANGNVLCIIE